MKNKRDASIELARVLASLIVIGVHSCLNVYHENYYDLNRVFISCLFADGVAIYWLIMGAFFFENSDYGKMFRKLFKNVGIPMIEIMVFTFYLAAWAIDETSLLQSVIHTKEDYMYMLNSLLRWESPGGYLGHLWYLYVYFMIILCFPVLKCFADYLDGSGERVKTFLVISFLILVVNDLSNNRLGMFSHHSFNALIPASLEVLWGHILYKNKSKFINKKGIIISIIVFLVLNICRTMVQFKYYLLDKGNHILFWYTGIGLLCAISLIVFSFSIMNKAGKSVKRLVCFISGHTFNVYLIHPLVIAKLQRLGIQDKLYQYVTGFDKTYIGEFVYTSFIVMIVFVLSMGISLFLRVINILLKKQLKVCRLT